MSLLLQTAETLHLACPDNVFELYADGCSSAQAPKQLVATVSGLPGESPVSVLITGAVTTEQAFEAVCRIADDLKAGKIAVGS